MITAGISDWRNGVQGSVQGSNSESPMSALGQKADIAGRQLDVRFVPKADIHSDHWNALSECSNIRKILPKILFLTAAGILIGIAHISDCCSQSGAPI
jgi:hypothetical protein